MRALNSAERRIAAAVWWIVRIVCGIALLMIFGLDVVGNHILALLGKPSVEHTHMHPAFAGATLALGAACLVPGVTAMVWAWIEPLLPVFIRTRFAPPKSDAPD